MTPFLRLVACSAFALVACHDAASDGVIDAADLPAADTERTTDVAHLSDLGQSPDQFTEPDGSTPRADASTADATTADVSAPCGGFGCPCADNADCLDGLCVEGPEGRICTINCVTECPSEAFACLPITLGGSDPFNACVPKFPNLCKPCRDASDCRNSLLPGQAALCVPARDASEGSFCGAACEVGDRCPEGFTCADVASQGGARVKQCLPAAAVCACRPAWANLGLVTDCMISNAFGACAGTRTCGVGGLTPCGPNVPAPETCNGRDDDCDGAADDVAANACVVTSSFGSCPGSTSCDAQGRDVCMGQTPVAEVCNGADDDCDASTDEGTCGDNLACTEDLCQGGAGTCLNPVLAGFCLINGVCWPDGAQNPDFPCQRCQATLSQTAWSGASGAAGSCFIGGVCYAGGAPNPSNPCLVCDPNVPSGWSLAPSGSACDDGQACTAGDVCTFGACVGKAYSCDGIGCCVGDGTCTNEAPPGAVEDCSDGLDNDCDGQVDEGTREVCGDDLDNDCDGELDESGSVWGEGFFARPWTTAGVPGVGIYTSLGDGTFEGRKDVIFPDTRQYGIVSIGDFDGDRYLDLIVATTDTTGKTRCTTTASCPANQDCVGGVCHARCTLSSTNTCPATPLTFDSSSCPAGDTCVSTSQYNGTGRCATRTILYLARESCPEGSSELLELARLNPGERVATVVDADNNGHLDFIIAHAWHTLTASTLLNNGDFTFTRRANTFNPLVQHRVTSPASATCCTWSSNLSRTPKDVDGDGVVDLIAFCNPNGGSTAATISWWKGRGDGFFGLDANGAHTGSWQPVSVPAGGFQAPASLMASDDFDGDGDIDIIAGLDDDGNSGAISILLNRSGRGAQSWATPYLIHDVTPSISAGGDSPGVGDGTSYDFTGDGLPDILAGWVPEGDCGPGSAWSCPWREVALIPNVTASPCGPNRACSRSGSCIACTPNCLNRRCGSDGCGGSCGRCADGETCVAGGCVPRETCTPSCDGRTCGDNGCGGVCGYCGAGEQCNAAGQCIANCQPACTNADGSPKVCGDDGCGGRCVVFGSKSTITREQGQGAWLTSPSNAPPRVDVARLLPSSPRRTDDLVCATEGVYDLDRATLHYDWYRNDVFFAAAGNNPILPERHTSTGEAWRCRIRATDGVEWSIPRWSETRIIGN
jgi:hypothetical protein